MAIARHLNRDGIPTSTGAAKWTQASVRNVLVNPLYAGKVRHDGAVYPGTHEAIISEETFAAAQRVRATTAAARRTAKNAKGNYRGLPSGSNNGGGRAPRGSHLFTRGVLRCGPCGDAMAPRTHRRRTGPETDVYQCLGRYRDEDSCDQLPVLREEIDAAMIEELDRRFLDLEATRTRYAARRAADASLAAETLSSAERELVSAENALARIRRDYRDRKINADEWRDFRDELEAQRAAAEAAAERARQRAEAVSDEDVTDEVLDRLRDLRATVLGGLDRAPDLDALRKLLRQMFESVTYAPVPAAQPSFFRLKWDTLDLTRSTRGGAYSRRSSVGGRSTSPRGLPITSA